MVIQSLSSGRYSASPCGCWAFDHILRSLEKGKLSGIYNTKISSDDMVSIDFRKCKSLLFICAATDKGLGDVLLGYCRTVLLVVPAAGLARR
jgi:hypothetical protein